MPINLSAKSDFESTKKEIEKYLTFLQHVENGDLVLKNSVINVGEGFSIDTELTNILKANTFLLLYNLVESTIRNLLWDIFLALQQDNVEYSQLVEGSGGYSNAFTSNDHTNYYFDVNPSLLPDALDM